LLQCQQTTSKKFNHKKSLKYAYEQLEKHNIFVDKKIKKDLNKRIQNRISERFFENPKETKAIICKSATGNGERASSKNLNGEYSNGFAIGIVEIAIGGVGVYFGPSPEIKVAGAGLAGHGVSRFIDALGNYIWPQNDERDNFSNRERDRDGQRPSMADRDMDRQGGGGRDRSRN